jgi:hypothetical protein
MAKRDAPVADVSHLLDLADEAMDALVRPDGEPDADPRHTLREEESMERARESRA